MAMQRSLYATDGAPARYAAPLRWLHWITAVLVAGLLLIGSCLTYFPPPDGPFKELLYELHESTGMTVWLLVLLRIAVRLATGAPALPGGTPRAVRVLATLNHVALYLVLLVQPLVGLMDANAWGAPLHWYGLFLVPSPIGRQPDPVAQQYTDLHWWGAATLVLLLALHVAGALYHGLVRRDGVLRHMA
jgi:cytochrome b561